MAVNHIRHEDLLHNFSVYIKEETCSTTYGSYKLISKRRKGSADDGSDVV